MEEQINSLEDLFIYQAREMYRAAQIESVELPYITDRVEDPELKRILILQILTVNEILRKLNGAFLKMNVPARTRTINWNGRLFERMRSLISQCKNPLVDDQFMIYPLRQMNYHKITMLGNMRSIAREIGMENVSDSMHLLVAAVELLDSELAQYSVNLDTDSADIALAN